MPNIGKNTYLFDDLISASKTKSKTLYYKWDKPNDEYNVPTNSNHLIQYSYSK